ncbi:GalNAc-alpha-(1-_4)-GalNAc-alpha-(1-_3)-diNAcBac-PP-undecaprenol alpha-1,4-N-acetyl-D-galactosaminyltransferase [Oligella sp. MSHR50489EDL]|uniref:glycosyltransferase family 4 protein n=1 Tax=Oligella sp. MSHR50489EDL TaxID=3139409 RepID=UPI003D81AC18
MLSNQSNSRILLYIPSLRGGGAERVAVELARRWVYDGHEVIVLTQSEPSTDVYQLDARVQRVSLNTFAKSGFFAHLTQIRRLRRELKRYRPDLLVSFMTSASVFAIIAAMGLPCKVIVTEHAYPPFQKLSKSWQRLRKLFYPKADRVVTLTQATADYLKKDIPKASFSVIPNAVQWPLEQHEPEIQMPKAEGKKWLLAVGRLQPVKGFDLLIESFAKFADAYPQWDLLILGEGPERDNLALQIERAGLQQRAFLVGRVGNMQWWYNNADLFVLSSRSEGLSNSLQEAMSCGLPCVAYDCDVGPRELIRHDIDGYLVQQSESVDALKDSIIHLINDPERMENYAKRAVDMRDRYSMRRISGMWNKLFQEILPDKI